MIGSGDKLDLEGANRALLDMVGLCPTTFARAGVEAGDRGLGLEQDLRYEVIPQDGDGLFIAEPAHHSRSAKLTLQQDVTPLSGL